MNFRKKNRPYMLLSAAVVALGVTMLTAYVSYRYGHSTAVADAATLSSPSAYTIELSRAVDLLRMDEQPAQLTFEQGAVQLTPLESQSAMSNLEGTQKKGKVCIFKSVGDRAHSGFTFDICRVDDSDIVVATVTTDLSGRAEADLYAGEYILRPNHTDDSGVGLYEITFTVVQGQTTELLLTSAQTARLHLKGASGGNQFELLYADSKDSLGIFTCDRNGSFSTDALMPGQYLLKGRDLEYPFTLEAGKDLTITLPIE